MLPTELERERVCPLLPRTTTTAHGAHVGGEIGLKCLLLSDVFSETSAEQTGADVRTAFDEIDTDGGGTLDRVELGQLSAKLGKPLSDPELDEMMAEIDTGVWCQATGARLSVCVLRRCSALRSPLSPPLRVHSFGWDTWLSLTLRCVVVQMEAATWTSTSSSAGGKGLTAAETPRQ